MNDLHKTLESLSEQVEELSAPGIAWETQSKWRRHFAPNWTDWTGVFGDREWHVLSSGCVAHARGARAVAMYESVLHTGDVLVSVALGSTSVYRCKAPVLPSCAQLRAAWDDDLYVIAADWSWTFVLTHEELHGPYFVEADVNPWTEEEQPERHIYHPN